METIVVGDIHGNAAALQSVLSQITTGTDPLSAVVFLGDYIDGGPELITEHKPLPYDRIERVMPDSHLSFLRWLRLFHETDECICSHAGVSRDFAGAELETQRALLWGSDEFPDYYSGKKLVVYGHFSKKAGFSNGKAVPLETENTICLDTTRHDVISALVLPERRLIQSATGHDAQDAQEVQSPAERVVVIIDDKDHALKQVIYEFPSVQKNQIVFRHFDTIAAFREARVDAPYIVFLDFFLSKDRDYGTAIIPELRCTHLVCFSSRKEMSDHMAEMARQEGHDRIANVYSVRKLKTSIENEELTATLRKIFAPG